MPKNIIDGSYKKKKHLNSTTKSSGDFNSQTQDEWFDASDEVEINHRWFDANDNYAEADFFVGADDSMVSITEDFQRGLQQLACVVGEYEENKILSICLSRILPGAPVSLVMVASSLYTALMERQNIDTALLHTLGLASWYLPDDINFFSPLAAYIRTSIINLTDETFLQQFFDSDENDSSTYLITALAVAAIIAGRWMKYRGKPSRWLLSGPAFVAKNLIRASQYWHALGNMASSNVISSIQMQNEPELSRQRRAFEVDTSIKMAQRICNDQVPDICSEARITDFSSYSTVDSDVLIKGTVLNEPTYGKSNNSSVPEKAHFLAVENFRMKNGLSNLLYCNTSKTETRGQISDEIITDFHFNTQCDATTYPQPLMKNTESPSADIKSLARENSPSLDVLSVGDIFDGSESSMATSLGLKSGASIPMVVIPVATTIIANNLVAANIADESEHLLDHSVTPHDSVIIDVEDNAEELPGASAWGIAQQILDTATMLTVRAGQTAVAAAAGVWRNPAARVAILAGGTLGTLAYWKLAQGTVSDDDIDFVDDLDGGVIEDEWWDVLDSEDFEDTLPGELTQDEYDFLGKQYANLHSLPSGPIEPYSAVDLDRLEKDALELKKILSNDRYTHHLHMVGHNVRSENFAPETNHIRHIRQVMTESSSQNQTQYSLSRDEYWMDKTDEAPRGSIEKKVYESLADHISVGPEMAAPRESFPDQDGWYTMMDYIDLSQYKEEFAEHFLQLAADTAASPHVDHPDNAINSDTLLHLRRYWYRLYARLGELWAQALLRKDFDIAQQYLLMVSDVELTIHKLDLVRPDATQNSGTTLKALQEKFSTFVQRTAELKVALADESNRQISLRDSLYEESQNGTLANFTLTFSDVFNEQNKLIYKVLTQNKLKYNKDKPLESVNAVVHYLSKARPAKKLNNISMQLCKPMGHYGSEVGDIIPRSRKEGYVGQWMDKNIFNMSIEQWLINKNKTLKNPTLFQHKNVKNSIDSKLAQMRDDKTFLKKNAMIYYKDKILLRTAPAFMVESFLEQKDRKELDEMEVTNPGWGYFHVGAMVLQESGASLKGLKLQDIQDVGGMIDALLRKGRLPSEFYEYFRLPALLYYSRAYSEELDLDNIDESKMQGIYKAYFDYIDRWMAENNPVMKYFKLSADWRSRSELAKQILKAHFMPEESVPSYLNTHFSTKWTTADGRVVDLPNIDTVFDEQNNKLGDAFLEMDKILLDALFYDLPQEEIDFLRRAKVKLVTADIVESDPEAREGNPFKTYESRILHIPDSVDLLLATVGGEERIYALKLDFKKGSYIRTQVDRYTSNLLPLIGDSKLPIEGKIYRPIIKDKGVPVIKTEGFYPWTMTEKLSGIHKERVIKELKETGYDKTTADKVGEFLLGLLPFYSCWEELEKGNVKGALASCAFDIAAIIPFLSLAAKISVKFLQTMKASVVTALRYGVVQTTVSQALKGAISNFVFPLIGAQEAIQLTKNLGKSFLRGIDPGFEGIISLVGKKGTSALRAATSEMGSGSPGISRLNEELGKKVGKDLKNPPKTTSMHFADNGPGLGRDLDVVPAGVADGRQTFVEVNSGDGIPLGPRFVRNGVGHLELAPVSLSKTKLYIPRLEENVLQGANKLGKKLTPATDAALGYTSHEGKLLYGESFTAVAQEYNVIISVRSPNPFGDTLLKEGFPTKNFHMKGKSSETGPTSGFIAREARYSKVAPESHAKQAAEITAAEAKGSKAVPLVLSKEQIENLVTAGKMKSMGNGRYSADYPGGKEEFFIDANGAVKDSAGKPVDVMTNPPEKGTLTFVEERKNGIPPYRIRPGKSADAADTTRPITADYDLFAIVCTKNRNDNYRPLIVAPRLKKGKFELDILQSRSASGVLEHPDKGNVSFFTETIIDALNKKISAQGYKGGKLVWHGDETANPFSPGFNINDKPIFFLPTGEVVQVHSMDQLKNLYRDLRALGYAPELSPRF
jgi:hypothetical protein